MGGRFDASESQVFGLGGDTPAGGLSIRFEAGSTAWQTKKILTGVAVTLY